MKRAICLLLALLLVFGALAGCSNNPGASESLSFASQPAASMLADSTTQTQEPLVEEISFAELMEERNLRARQAAEADFSLVVTEDMTWSYDGEEGEPDAGTIQRLLAPGGQTAITKEDVLDDIEWFFTMLRLGYGGYGYYGGPEVFDKALSEALEAAEALEGEWIAPHDFSGILADSLSFVDDMHFNIGGTSLNDKYAVYYAEDLYLAKGDDGYYLQEENEYWKLVSVDGEAADGYVKTTISENGQLVYGLFFTTTGIVTKQAQWDAVLTRLGETKTLPLSWKRAAQTSGVYGDESTIEEDDKNGISIHRIHRMHGDLNTHKLFRDSGKALREQPIFIVDLRENGGGSDLYPRSWFEGYADNYPRYPSAYAFNLSSFSLEAMGWDPRGEDFAGETEDGDWLTGYETGMWMEDENVTFVLTDRGVASSGETMVLQFSCLENTLFVGTPTLGCDLVGNCMNKYLPHSGLSVYFGHTLFLSAIEEGVGFEPDIWIDPAYAESAVLHLIDYYGLKEA